MVVVVVLWVVFLVKRGDLLSNWTNWVAVAHMIDALLLPPSLIIRRGFDFDLLNPISPPGLDIVVIQRPFDSEFVLRRLFEQAETPGMHVITKTLW